MSNNKQDMTNLKKRLMDLPIPNIITDTEDMNKYKRAQEILTQKDNQSIYKTPLKNNNNNNQNEKKYKDSISKECKYSYDSAKYITPSSSSLQKNEHLEKKNYNDIPENYKEITYVRGNSQKTYSHSTHNSQNAQNNNNANIGVNKSPLTTIPTEKDEDNTIASNSKNIAKIEQSVKLTPCKIKIPSGLITNDQKTPNSYGHNNPNHCRIKQLKTSSLKISSNSVTNSPLSSSSIHHHLYHNNHNRSPSSAILSQNKILNNLINKKADTPKDSTKSNALFNSRALEKDENIYCQTQGDTHIDEKPLIISTPKLKNLKSACNSPTNNQTLDLNGRSPDEKPIRNIKLLINDTDIINGNSNSTSNNNFNYFGINSGPNSLNSTTTLGGVNSANTSTITRLTKQQLTDIQFNNNIKYLEQSLLRHKAENRLINTVDNHHVNQQNQRSNNLRNSNSLDIVDTYRPSIEISKVIDANKPPDNNCGSNSNNNVVSSIKSVDILDYHDNDTCNIAKLNPEIILCTNNNTATNATITTTNNNINAPIVNPSSPKISATAVPTSIANPSTITIANNNTSFMAGTTNNNAIFDYTKDIDIKESNIKSKIMNVILELKNKINDKDKEIIDLQSNKLRSNLENQNLQIKINDMLIQQKLYEDKILKLTEKLDQKDNIKSLFNKDDHLHSISTTSSAFKDIQYKIQKYDDIIDQKSKEILSMQENLNLLINKNIKLENDLLNINKQNRILEEKLSEKEKLIKQLENQVWISMSSKQEYHDIQNKINELEDMQNQLIRENEQLKAKLNKTRPHHQTESDLNLLELASYECDPAHAYKRDYPGILIASSKKIKEIEELGRKIIKILENVLKGEEPPIELILKYQKIYKHKKLSGTYNDIGNKENELDVMNVYQLSQKNVQTIDSIHQMFMQTMDIVCDTLANKYGNECTIQ